MDGDRMPKVDLSKDSIKLSTSDLHWIKRVEQENIDRVKKLKVIRNRNLIVGGLLGATVLSIYSYTLKAIKQEQYFDDFDLPETTVSEE